MNGPLFAAAILAMIPAANILINLFLVRTPNMPGDAPPVAILIPARNEEANIGACVDAALASVGADVEVIVLCLLYTSPSPRDGLLSRMPSSA